MSATLVLHPVPSAVVVAPPDLRQVRRILAHCGLPFEEACLHFHETERAIKTASSEQVRQPLYTRALGTWRRYEKHLGPWQEELGDIIAELPDSVRNAGL